MGSCQSTPSDTAEVTTAGSASQVVSVDVTTTTKVSKSLTNSSSVSTEKASGALPKARLQKPSKIEQQESKTESETEEIQSNADRSDRRTPSPKDSHTKSLKGGPDVISSEYERPSTEPPTSLERESLSKLRVGYSSGASSDSDDPDVAHRRVSSRKNLLLELKHSLSIDGDVCKGVVRIETDFGRPIEQIYEGVHDGPVLGSGVAGIVRRVKHRKTGVNYAVKCLDLDLIQDEKGVLALREEVGIMCQLDHPNIVRLEEVYENESEIYLIQELCTGGDLFDRLDEQPEYHYSEVKCAKLVKQMLSSVRYLHSKNIIHRDLKLENFLFSSHSPDSDLKMIDFGLSKHFTPYELHQECVGTPYTVAPEILISKYNEKVDIWALGVITYLLLSGETPFGGADDESFVTVRNNILRGKCTFQPVEIWDHVSDSGKAFIKRLLDPVSMRRPTAKEAQCDAWLQTYGKRDAKIGKNLNPKLCRALVEFKEYSDMRKVLCEVLSFTLLPEQIVDLRQEFEKVDPEGEGEISLETLKQVLIDSAEEGSLGALTEAEVEGIFDAVKLSKTEPKIRWHEFIAAGLSQCNFDERNLKLAFDRLDYDRKGFITLDDMKDLLGASKQEEDEVLAQMWQDGLRECVCPLGRITYDDFRMFIKGQKREKEPTSPVPKLRAKRLSLEPSPLQAVPEGSMSPQRKHQVFEKFQKQSALDMLKMPLLSVEGLEAQEIMGKPKETDIGFPSDVPTIPKPSHNRMRSRSLGESPLEETLHHIPSDELRRKSTCVVLPSKVIDELHSFIRDESTTPLAVNKALYRKQREFRQSVLVASKLFDQKEKTRKLETAQSTSVSDLGDTHKWQASLVMRRGTPQRSLDSSMTIASDHQGEIVHADQSAPKVMEASAYDHTRRVADAAKRSGRPRRPRKKTTSDISGMLR